jgi:hypothetical protein
MQSLDILDDLIQNANRGSDFLIGKPGGEISLLLKVHLRRISSDFSTGGEGLP